MLDWHSCQICYPLEIKLLLLLLLLLSYRRIELKFLKANSVDPDQTPRSAPSAGSALFAKVPTKRDTQGIKGLKCYRKNIQNDS